MIETIDLLGVALFVGSMLLCMVFTSIVRKLALKLQFVSKPSEDRFSQQVVPLGGGIAIFLTIFNILIFSILTVRYLAQPGRLGFFGDMVLIHTEGFISKINHLLIVLLCLLILFIIGLWDDMKKLSPFFKLIIQFAAAFLAAYVAEIRVELFIDNIFVTTCLSAVWIVLIINVFNFLDNMDGASAGIAVIISSVLFFIAVFSGQVFVGAMAIILIGTLIGFLIFNFPPAKIYMGDAGSLVVGFLVAVLSLRTTYYQKALSGDWYPVLLPLVTMAVPLYDFISVTFLRLSQGKSPFVGDTQHFSHRLKRHGLTDTQTVLTLYLATLCTSLAGLFLYQVNILGAFLIFIQTFLILAIIAIFESTSKNKSQ